MVPKPNALAYPVQQQVTPAFVVLPKDVLLSPDGGMAMAAPSSLQSKEFNMPLDDFWKIYFDHVFNSGRFATPLLLMKYYNNQCEALPLQWVLIPVGSAPITTHGSQIIAWNEYSETAKVRFHCSNDRCERNKSGWTSVNGVIQFWWQILPSITGVPTGYVAYKLFGQKCASKSCDIFEPAMWYHEEVEKVLWNVFVEIRRKLLPPQNPPLFPVSSTRQGRTKPKRPHEQDNCEACHFNSCPSMRSCASSESSSRPTEEYQEQSGSGDAISAGCAIQMH